MCSLPGLTPLDSILDCVRVSQKPHALENTTQMRDRVLLGLKFCLQMHAPLAIPSPGGCPSVPFAHLLIAVSIAPGWLQATQGSKPLAADRRLANVWRLQYRLAFLRPWIAATVPELPHYQPLNSLFTITICASLRTMFSTPFPYRTEFWYLLIIT